MDLSTLAHQLGEQGELRLCVKVVPKSGRTEIAGWMANGTLKVRTQAPPEGGKANRELCLLLARQFGVPARNVAIVSGHSAPLKQIRIRRE